MIGSGRNNDYEHDGFTHYAGDDIDHLNNFKNIKGFWPENKLDIFNTLKNIIDIDGPCYLNLKR
jgi:transketolase C-terminal domain/subunit